MRLWHKELIPVLPRNRLVSQWRELVMVHNLIADKGTPNHILVNRVCDYPFSHFYSYTNLVQNEMWRRGYATDISVERKLFTSWEDDKEVHLLPIEDIYKEWHNDRYMLQCYYNLQEKYDCDNVNEREWHILDNFVFNRVFINL